MRMNVKRTICASSLAAGVGLAILFGGGLGTANAQPGPGCVQMPGPGNNWVCPPSPPSPPTPTPPPTPHS